MMGKFFQIALLAVPLLLGACSKPQAEAPPKTAEIKGQVFVAQNDGQNIKLGGVEVRYVPRAEFQKRCRWIAEHGPKASQLANYRSDLQRIDSAIGDIAKEKHAGKMRDFLSSARLLQADARKRLEESPAAKKYQMLLLIREESRKTFEDAGFEREEDQWALAALFYDWLLKHATVLTQTDADGYYMLTLPGPADGYVFVQTSRQVGKGKVENYHWIQEVTSSTTGPVHLSNIGLLTPVNLHDFIPAAADAEKPSIPVTEEFGLRDLSWFKEAGTLLDKIATNERSVAKLKTRIKEVEAEMEAAKYQDMSTQ